MNTDKGYFYFFSGKLYYLLFSFMGNQNLRLPRRLESRLFRLVLKFIFYT